MKKLLGLLVVGGVVTIGGVAYRLVTPDDGVTLAMLRDAGIANLCDPALAVCSVVMTEEGLTFAKAQGIVDGGHASRYVQTVTPIFSCVTPTAAADRIADSVGAKPADGGVAFLVFPELPKVARRKAFALDVEACKVVPCATYPGLCGKGAKAVPFEVLPLPCAWRAFDAGVCLFVDGGDPGTENTYPAEKLTGPGCRRKACTEIAGVSSDPSPLRRLAK